MKHLVIIGNGITGVTTARYVRKMSDMKITLISAETDHFYSRTALMYIYMGHMTYQQTKPYEDWFWEENRINLVKARISEVDTDERQLKTADGQIVTYDVLLIATGSVSYKFGCPGENLPGVQGLYSLQDLELLEKNTSGIDRAVIIGGGLIGIELAEMLLSRKIHVTFLVREKLFWDIVLPEEEARLVTRHIREHDIDLKLETELGEILVGPDGRTSSVVTNQGEKISTPFVGLTVGVQPNIHFLRNSNIKLGRGVLVNRYLETNIPGIYAAGDCAEIVEDGEQRGSVEHLWYTGRMQGEALAKILCGERKPYHPGLWYNSAKFLDMEYQTYGHVPIKEHSGLASLFWQSADYKKCLRVVYEPDSQSVVGFNVLGIRLRQKICHQWIEQGVKLDYVLENLRKANFDPEFFRSHEHEIRSQFLNAADTLTRAI